MEPRRTGRVLIFRVTGRTTPLSVLGTTSRRARPPAPSLRTVTPLGGSCVIGGHVPVCGNRRGPRPSTPPSPDTPLGRPF